MLIKHTLKVVPFKNPGGSISYRVTGRLCGIKVEKNFKTSALAEQKIAELVNAAGQGKSLPTRTVQTTFPTNEDLQEAQNAFFRLQAAQPGASLRFAVDYFLTRNPTVVQEIAADKALDDFNEARHHRGTEAITRVTTTTVLNKFFKTQKIGKISAITPANVKAFVTDATVAARTQRDRYDILNNFSHYLEKNRHIAANLVAHVDRPTVKNDGTISYFRVAVCQRLLDLAATEPAGRERIRGAMLPYYAQCMLSGLRPDEAQRMRPDWSNHSFGNGVITGFRAKTPAKTRTVKMHDELPGILQQCQVAGLTPGYFSRKAFERIQELAGIKPQGWAPPPKEADLKLADRTAVWDNDILRHGYASHHYALHMGMDFLIKNMGNSEDVLNSSYLNQTVLPAAGVDYFKMKPANMTILGQKAPMPGRPAKVAPVPASIATKWSTVAAVMASSPLAIAPTNLGQSTP